MHIQIGKAELLELVQLQVRNLFASTRSEQLAIAQNFEPALIRTEACFKATQDYIYYKIDGVLTFNPFHTGQYSIFLYFLSNEVWKASSGCRSAADKIYYLNKALNSLDIFYEVEMPSVFFLDHPVGTVIGRAKIGDGFRFSQNCTVGNNHGIFPRLGRNVTMHSGSKIIGDCSIGDNVVVSANTYIKDQDIPADSLVFGSTPNLIVKKARASVVCDS